MVKDSSKTNICKKNGIICKDCRVEYKKKQERAGNLVYGAINEGYLEKPDTCCLCNIKLNSKKIVAHHWNGYDDPFNVWWICYRCNKVLSGFYYHRGEVSLKEAKELIKKLNQRGKNKTGRNKHSVYVDYHLWDEATVKCKRMKMSKVIGILLTKWINEEVKITAEEYFNL